MTRKHPVPPASEIMTVMHAYPMSGGFNTNSLAQSITDATNSVKGRGGNFYNPDVAIPQYPCLRGASQNINDPNFREALFLDSPFLRAHTEDIINRIVRMGWKYVKAGTKINDAMQQWRKNRFNTGEPSPIDEDGIDVILPEWDDNLKVKFVEALSKALVVGTTFLTRFKQPLNGDYDVVYRIFSPWHKRYGFLDDCDRIEEIYLVVPQKPQFRYRKGNVPAYQRLVGFLTQFCGEDQAKPLLGYLPPRFFGLNTGMNITRNCVVIQPKEDINDSWGFPYFYRECQTALEKIYLRNIEFCFLDDGGMKTTIVVATDLDPTAKMALNTQMLRGIKSHGILIEADASRNAQDCVSIGQSQIPDLHFDTINSHLSEDAILSKQGVEGEAASGALGGVSPIVNQQEDDEVIENMFPMVANVIKAINWVFFNIPQNTYEIYFNRHADLVQAIPSSSDEGDASSSPNDSPPRNKVAAAANYFRGDENNSDGVLVAHSITDSYIQFEGNMLQAGDYNYEDAPINGKTHDTITAEEIRRITERRVRSAYLELDHSFNVDRVALNEGIGDFQIHGFDKQTGKDQTTFYLKKNVWEKIGSPQKIKVSPYFKLVEEDVNGKKEKNIYIMNCAVMNKQRDRASASGLDASASLVKP